MKKKLLKSVIECLLLNLEDGEWITPCPFVGILSIKCVGQHCDDCIKKEVGLE